MLHCDATPFFRGRDRTQLSSMLAALASDEWRKQTDFVNFVAAWLVGRMQWGAGCDCHEAALLAGEAVVCCYKGRRLRKAHALVDVRLKNVLEESVNWTEDTWGLGHAALVQLQGRIRFAFFLELRKFRRLDRLPYLLCRLAEPGVAARCIEQWDSADPREHHRVTRRFVMEGGALRADIQAIEPSGSGMSDTLEQEVIALGNIPMDDSIAEGPHARAMRIANRSRRACWPWVASTLRLEANLSDARELVSATDVDLPALWCGYTSILRVGGRSGLKPVKMNRQKFVDYLYRMAFAKEPMPQQHGDQDDGDDDHGDGGDAPDDADPPPDPPLPRDRPGDDAPGDDHGGGGPGGGAGGYDGPDAGDGKGPPRGRIPPEPELVKLLRQYLSASLEVHAVISIVVECEEGAGGELFFQVLQLDCRGLFVETFRSVDDLDYEEGLYRISVQPYSRWSGFVEHADLLQEADCYIYQDPCFLDVLAVAGATDDARSNIRVWQTRQSDVEGCINARSPGPLVPRMALSHASVPVLASIDAMEAQGYKGEKRKGTHSAETPKEYDSRRVLPKRTYFQRILALPELLAAGSGMVESGHSGACYSLLLRTKKLPTPGLAAKEYKRLVAAAQGDHIAFRFLDREAPKPPPCQPRCRLEPLDEDVAGDPEEQEIPAESLVAEDGRCRWRRRCCRSRSCSGRGPSRDHGAGGQANSWSPRGRLVVP
jgi:hypothetical protein